MHEQPIEPEVRQCRVTMEVEVDILDPAALRRANLARASGRPTGPAGQCFDLMRVLTQAVRGLNEAECGIRLTGMSAGAAPMPKPSDP